jgi:hypothetical protein
MIRYPEFRERGWQIGTNYAQNGLKATDAVGIAPTRRPLRPSMPWIETANGIKSGQTPARQQLKVAKNAGHTPSKAAIDGNRLKPYDEREHFRHLY